MIRNRPVTGYIVLALLFTGFTAVQSQAPKTSVPDAAEFPGFRVELELSPKARQKLIERKETVIVAGYLSGEAKKGALKRYIDEMGQINLGEVKAEVAPGENASISAIHIKQILLDQVDEQGAQIDINVFSGRKSSGDNLIDCGIWEGALKDAATAKIHIACKLIGE